MMITDKQVDDMCRKLAIAFGVATTDDLVKEMVDRFLGWKLPKDFAPDAGISFKAEYNENTPWPSRHEPIGTNLFHAGQAEEMVRHMLGLPNVELRGRALSPAVGRSDSNVGLGIPKPILRTVFELTEEQREAVDLLLLELLKKPGSSIIAQVYSDGVRCRVLDIEETASVILALNTPDGCHSSAFSAELAVNDAERNIDA